MTLKSYIILMASIASLCWAIWIFIIRIINPETTNHIGFFLFYFSLFLALSVTTAIFGFLARFVFLKHELASHAVKEAFRQSFLFAFLIITALFLLANDLFTWLNMALLVVGLSIFEFFLINCFSRQKKETENKEKENQKIKNFDN